MVCLGFEPGAAGWKARTNPLSYGGTPLIDSLASASASTDANADFQTGFDAIKFLLTLKCDKFCHYPNPDWYLTKFEFETNVLRMEF